MPSRKSLLVFGIADRLCALPLEDVQEIVLMSWLSRPPGMPSILEGLLNLRGTAVPVISLGRMFRLPEKPVELYSSLVILRGHDHLLALLVDHVSQVLSVSVETLMPVRGEHSFNNCTQAEVAMAGRVVHVLSPERLLIEKEQQCLREFQGIEQQRLQELEAQPT